LDSILPAPRGIPQIEVSFDIDANGILTVSAKDKATSKSQKVRIEASTTQLKEEIEKLKQEAQAHDEEDTKKKELVEAKNQAEQLIYAAEKSLRDAGDKVSSDIKEAVNQKIEALKKVKDGNDANEIKSAISNLSLELQRIGQSMYNKKEPPKEEPPKEEPNQEKNNVG